jgi:putative solute:sodium symporter small subunit
MNEQARASSMEQRLQEALDRYWRSNLRVMAALLAVWAFVSLGCGVLFADWLNRFKLPFTGFPLGFWFAQQGSIIVFVLCILAYCLAMNRLDEKHHRERMAIGRDES